MLRLGFSVILNKPSGVAVSEAIGDPTRGVTDVYRAWLMPVIPLPKGRPCFVG